MVLALLIGHLFVKEKSFSAGTEEALLFVGLLNFTEWLETRGPLALFHQFCFRFQQVASALATSSTAYFRFIFSPFLFFLIQTCFAFFLLFFYGPTRFAPLTTATRSCPFSVLLSHYRCTYQPWAIWKYVDILGPGMLAYVTCIAPTSPHLV